MKKSGRWGVLVGALIVVLVVAGCAVLAMFGPGRVIKTLFGISEGAASASADVAPVLPSTAEPPPAPNPQLRVTLAAPASLSGGEPVPLDFTITNEGSDIWLVLDWFTPLEGIRNNIFNVTRDGALVPYEGPMVMRGEPQADECVVLAAGESVSAQVDLGEFYDFSQPGTYTVEFTAPIFSHTISSEAEIPEVLDELLKLAAPRNPVTVTVTSPQGLEPAAPTGTPEDEVRAEDSGVERYVDADYGFAFRYPASWTLGGQEEHTVTLAQGAYQLVVAFKKSGEDAPPPWTGLPAGDLEARDPIPFMGQEIDKQTLIYEGKVKALLYGAEINGVRFDIRLDDVATADYAAIEITEAVQREVDDIVASFEATPVQEPRGSRTIVGTIADASPSARIITLAEPVDGFNVIALTEESELLSAGGSAIELRDIQPGMTVRATGEPGTAGVLLASQVQLTDG